MKMLDPRLDMSTAIPGTMMDVDLTIGWIFEHMRRNHGARTVVSRLDDGTTVRYTYADFAKRVAQLAHALVELGIKPGDRVASFGWNTHRHLELYFAVPMIGAVLHTTNIRLFPEQVCWVFDHAGDKLVFLDASLAPQGYRRSTCRIMGSRNRVVPRRLIVAGRRQAPVLVRQQQYGRTPERGVDVPHGGGPDLLGVVGENQFAAHGVQCRRPAFAGERQLAMTPDSQHEMRDRQCDEEHDDQGEHITYVVDVEAEGRRHEEKVECQNVGDRQHHARTAAQPQRRQRRSQEVKHDGVDRAETRIQRVRDRGAGGGNRERGQIFPARRKEPGQRAAMLGKPLPQFDIPRQPVTKAPRRMP